MGLGSVTKGIQLENNAWLLVETTSLLALTSETPEENIGFRYGCDPNINFLSKYSSILTLSCYRIAKQLYFGPFVVKTRISVSVVTVAVVCS